MRSLLLLIPLAFALACELQPPVTPEDKPAPTTEPAKPIEPTPDVNEAACQRFEELGCQSRDGRNLWEPTPGGVECPDVFKNAQKNGVDLHPECIAEMESCDEREACSTQQ